jgi:hypothetical protein
MNSVNLVMDLWKLLVEFTLDSYRVAFGQRVAVRWRSNGTDVELL